MKRASATNGVLLCFLLNLLLNFEWGIISLVLYLLHLWVGLPKMFSIGILILWFVMALLLTILVKWGNSSTNKEIYPPNVNKNPYSAKNEKIFKNDKDER